MISSSSNSVTPHMSSRLSVLSVFRTRRFRLIPTGDYPWCLNQSTNDHARRSCSFQSLFCLDRPSGFWRSTKYKKKKRKKTVHLASRKPEKASWEKRGIPRDWKPERAVQAKEGLKRTTASGMIVCALVKASWIIPGRDQSESSCSEGRKYGESWGHMGCNLVGTRWDRGFILPLG